MKLTAKGRYAVMAMTDLAAQGEGAVVSLADISARQKISQIFPRVRKSRNPFLSSFFANYVKRDSFRASAAHRGAISSPHQQIGSILRRLSKPSMKKLKPTAVRPRRKSLVRAKQVIA